MGNTTNAEQIMKVIEDKIFDNIHQHKLFGQYNYWNEYMQFQVLSSLSNEGRALFPGVVDKLVCNGVLEDVGRDGLYRVTENGQNLIFASGLFTIDDTKLDILSHLKEKQMYFENTVWPERTYLSYCENELMIDEQFFFKKAIDEMIDEGLFALNDRGDIVITKRGEEKINYGI